MKTTISIDDQLYAQAQANGENDIEKLVNTALREYLNRLETPFDKAVTAFRENLKRVSADLEFEVPQIVGHELWETLDRGSRLSFGKQIKANQAAFAVEYIRTTKSNHAVYRRA